MHYRPSSRCYSNSRISKFSLLYFLQFSSFGFGFLDLANPAQRVVCDFVAFLDYFFFLVSTIFVIMSQQIIKKLAEHLLGNANSFQLFRLAIRCLANQESQQPPLEYMVMVSAILREGCSKEERKNLLGGLSQQYQKALQEQEQCVQQLSKLNSWQQELLGLQWKAILKNGQMRWQLGWIGSQTQVWTQADYKSMTQSLVELEQCLSWLQDWNKGNKID